MKFYLDPSKEENLRSELGSAGYTTIMNEDHRVVTVKRRRNIVAFILIFHETGKVCYDSSISGHGNPRLSSDIREVDTIAEKYRAPWSGISYE